ncbi:MAG: shufflon system plasmid conjugative transfer pilus tip adhesin PilV, partial [Alphaproteobacteria bacterium]|nr:shufflon system plasmid conjugative transfer pilus tip adhesin PilV [Alphaproteobacteria bacterium]
MGKNRNQIGRMMLEMLLFIGLLLAISPFIYRKAVERAIEREDIGIANNLRVLRDASRVLIDSGDWRLCRQNEGEPAPRTDSVNCDVREFKRTFEVADLMQYIPEGTRTRSRAFDSFMLGTLCSIERVGNQCRKTVTGLIVTTGGTGEVNDMRGNRIASLVGGEGGYIRSPAFNIDPDDTFRVHGAGAAWRLDATDFFTDDNLSPQLGRVAVLVRGSESGDFDGRILHRERIDGFEDANRMLTTLDMGGHDIVNIGAADARHIRVMGREGHRMIQMDASDSQSLMLLHRMGADGSTGVTITIDGSTGVIHMTEYAEVFRGPGPHLEDQETGAWAVAVDNRTGEGRTAEDRLWGCIRHDADGNCDEEGFTYGIDADGVSVLRDLRIQSLGGAALSSIAPRWSLMDIHRSLMDDMRVPAPGYRRTGDSREFEREIVDGVSRNTCPVGFTPVLVLNRTSRDCEKISGNALEKARCHWPNPDYLPFFNRQPNPAFSGPSPLQFFVVARGTLGIAGGYPFAPFDRYDGWNTQILMYGSIPNIRDVPVFVRHGFTPVYDNMECHFRPGPDVNIISSNDVFPESCPDSGNQKSQASLLGRFRSNDVFPRLFPGSGKPKPLAFLLDFVRLRSQAHACCGQGQGQGQGDPGDPIIPPTQYSYQCTRT